MNKIIKFTTAIFGILLLTSSTQVNSEMHTDEPDPFYWNLQTGDEFRFTVDSYESTFPFIADGYPLTYDFITQRTIQVPIGQKFTLQITNNTLNQRSWGPYYLELNATYNNVSYNLETNLLETSFIMIPDWVYWNQTLSERFNDVPTIEGEVVMTPLEFYVWSLSFWGSGQEQWFINDTYSYDRTTGILNFIDHERAYYSGNTSNVVNSTKYVLRQSNYTIDNNSCLFITCLEPIFTAPTSSMSATSSEISIPTLDTGMTCDQDVCDEEEFDSGAGTEDKNANGFIFGVSVFSILVIRFVKSKQKSI